MTALAIYFAAGFACSVVLTPLCRRTAQRLGYVARPSDDRWHRRPTALLGGVSIAAATLGLGATLGLSGPVGVLLLSGLAIGVFGLIDDVLALKASTKLIAQIVV